MKTNFPKTWRKVKLGEVLELKYGFGLPETKRKTGRVPVFGSSGIVGTHNEAAVQSQGIVIGRKGHVGSIHYSNVPFYPIDTVYYVDQLKIPGDIKFFYYFLKRIPFQQIGSDVGVPGLNRDIAYGLEVKIPEDPNIQKRIADVLSAFDDKIELNNKISKNLEAMAQAIFKEWFVKFRFPGYEKTKFVNSELGQIPKGWKIGKIKDVVGVISGYPFSSRLYSPKDGLGVVTIKNVQDGQFITEFNSFIKKENIPTNLNSTYYLKSGDIILSLTGNVGRVCFVYGGEYLLNQRVAKLVPKRPNDFAYCYFLFRQGTMQNYMINMAKGSAQPNLSPVEMSNTSLVIPPSETLDDFSKIAAPIYERILNNSNQYMFLTSLRDLLLPKLMNGGIRV